MSLENNKIKYFRDPIHGFIEVSPFELKVISHPLFQRLRRIKQIGLGEYVYHGANHTRFAHSLGVMHIVKRILEILKINEEDYKNKIILAALLHDIGHFPLSHSFEYALNLNHEDYTKEIIYRTEIKDILSERYSNKDIRDIIGFISGTHAKYPIGSQLINSEIDADKLDYLLRDSLHCGVKYGVYDLERLLISLEIPDNIVVISHRGFDLAEEFILARFFMYKQVYLHKTKRAFEILLEIILKELQNKGLLEYPKLKEDLDMKLPEKDDIWLFSKLREVRKNYNIDERLRRYINMLLKRDPLRVPPLGSHEEYVEIGMEKITERFHDLIKIKENANFLNMLKRYDIEPETVFVDQPSLKIKEEPYYSVSKEEVSEKPAIWILDRDGSVKEISHIPGSLTRSISTKKLYMVRIYTLPEHRKHLNIVLTKVL